MEDPEAFAREWAEAWHRRDIESVVSHFAADAVFISPRAARLTGSAQVAGRAALGRYWSGAAAQLGETRFVVGHVVWDGARQELVVIYDRLGAGGRVRACEIMRFAADGLVQAGEAMFGASF